MGSPGGSLRVGRRRSCPAPRSWRCSGCTLSRRRLRVSEPANVEASRERVALTMYGHRVEEARAALIRGLELRGARPPRVAEAADHGDGRAREKRPRARDDGRRALQVRRGVSLAPGFAALVRVLVAELHHLDGHPHPLEGVQLRGGVGQGDEVEVPDGRRLQQLSDALHEGLGGEGALGEQRRVVGVAPRRGRRPRSPMAVPAHPPPGGEVPRVGRGATCAAFANRGSEAKHRYGGGSGYRAVPG